MSNRLGGKQGTAYLGTNANQPPNMAFNDRPPTAYDINYSIGDFWIDDSAVDTQKLWVLVSLQGNSTSKGLLAHWVQLGPGVPSNVNTLTGNSGGVVPPDGANNINVIGDGITTDVAGNPGTNTLLITATAAVPTQFDADVGSAVPLANILNVIGAGSTTTSAAGNTITITSTGGGTGILTLTGDVGGAVGPDGANNVNILGSADIIVTGNPGTNTLAIDSAGFLANQFDTDSGTAVPVGGILEILAQNATLGCGSTVLFSAPGSTNVVQLDVTDSSLNTIIGSDSGVIGSGTANTGLGNQVLTAVTTASNNVAVGNFSGNAVTSGSQNVLLGVQAGGMITTANNNVIIGDLAGNSITTGSDNILIGKDSGTALSTTDNLNINIGNAVGIPGEIGTIRIGQNSASSSGANTFIGNQAGNSTYTLGVAGSNTFVGYQSGTSLTGGFTNAFFGSQCGTSITTGNGNCFFGHGTGLNATTASRNLAIGASVGQGLTSGTDNTLLGINCANNLTTGTRNICIGHDSGGSIGATSTTNIYIDNDGANENRTIRIGNTSDPQTRCFIRGIRGVTTGIADALIVRIDSNSQLGTTSSSRRYKDNIQDLGNDSEIIYQLRPVKFNFKSHPEVPAWGLIAEEVEEVFPSLVVYDEKQEQIESVKYDELIPLLLNEIQKLKSRVDNLEK